MKLIQEIATLCTQLHAATKAGSTHLVASINKQLDDIQKLELPNLQSGIIGCVILRDRSDKDRVELSVTFSPMDDVGNILKSQWLRVIIKPCLMYTISIRILGSVSKWDKETVDNELYNILLSENKTEMPW